MTQPCKKSGARTLRSHPMPDHGRLQQWNCSMSPRRTDVHPVAPRGALPTRPSRSKKHPPGRNGRPSASTLIPIAPALLRPLMQLPCLKNVPSREKNKASVTRVGDDMTAAGNTPLGEPPRASGRGVISTSCYSRRRRSAMSSSRMESIILRSSAPPCRRAASFFLAPAIV
jgi:hypothetical protein